MILVMFLSHLSCQIVSHFLFLHFHLIFAPIILLFVTFCLVLDVSQHLLILGTHLLLLIFDDCVCKRRHHLLNLILPLLLLPLTFLLQLLLQPQILTLQSNILQPLLVCLLLQTNLVDIVLGHDQLQSPFLLLFTFLQLAFFVC
jgi:hypothetical protein